MKKDEIWAVSKERLEALYPRAVEEVQDAGRASTAFLQRKLKIGYVVAGKLMDLMQERGIIGGKEGSAPRKVL